MPRRPRRRPLSRGRKIIRLIKRNPLKTIGLIAPLVVILGGIVPAVTGLGWLDKATDPWHPALHWWVYEQVDKVDQKVQGLGSQNQGILRDLQIDTANGKLSSTNNDIKKWQLELSKAQEEDSKELITKQIDALQTTKAKLEAQLNTLSRLRRP